MSSHAPAKAWQALKALLQSWKTQDDEGAKIVAAVCSAFSRSEEFRAQARRVAAAEKEEHPTVGSGGGSLLDLFPGAWENLRLKTLTSVADSHFRQLDSMMTVLQDAQRSIDALLEGLMAAVVGSASGPEDVSTLLHGDDVGGDSGLLQQQWAMRKGLRTLEEPVSAMDHLEWLDDVARMYRAELLRKRAFVADLKRAVNGGPTTAGSLRVPATRGARYRFGDSGGNDGGNDGGDGESGDRDAEVEEDEEDDDDDDTDDEEEEGEKDGDPCSLDPAVAGLWATDTSPTSLVRIAALSLSLSLSLSLVRSAQRRCC